MLRKLSLGLVLVAGFLSVGCCCRRRCATVCCPSPCAPACGPATCCYGPDPAPFGGPAMGPMPAASAPIGK